MNGAETSVAREARLAAEIEFFAQRLVDLDLLEWYGGNISVRLGNDLLINRTRAIATERGAMPVVRTGIFEDDENTPWASSALAIHRAIYQRTDAQTIIHAHPRHATLLSFFVDEIVPVEENGFLYIGPGARVIAAPVLYGWNLVADALADALRDRRAVMLKWHGSFVKGDTLDEAMHATRGLNNAAEFILRLHQHAPYFPEIHYLPTTVCPVKGGEGTRLLPPELATRAGESSC